MKFRLKKRYYKPLAIWSVCIIIFTILCFLDNFVKKSYAYPADFTVHYINVGQGDSALIQVNHKNMLIDAGPESSRKHLKKYLKSLNIDTLDYVIATHPHEDHIGGMADIINSFDVKNFYAPKAYGNDSSFERMAEALKEHNLKINTLARGTDTIDLGKNVKISVYSPFGGDTDNLNNYSPVMKITYKNTPFLFTGDAEKEVEEKLCSLNDDLNSAVLKAGHHGSKTSSSAEFLNKVSPEVTLISCGEGNKYDHPNDETINALNNIGCRILRTDKDGDIVLVSDGDIIKMLKKNAS